MLHFTGSNPKGNGTKGSVGCGMAISTDNKFSRLGPTSFRAHHMNDSLLSRTMGSMINPKVHHILS